MIRNFRTMIFNSPCRVERAAPFDIFHPITYLT